MKNLKSVFDLLLFPFLFVLFLTGTTLFASNTPTISISPATYDIKEGSGTVTVDLNISISEDPNASDINVTWETADGSAVAGVNYVAKSDIIIFPQGSSTGPTSIPIDITVNSDVLITGDIAFTVELTKFDRNASQSYTASPTVANIRIINNDPPTANNKAYRIDVNSQLIGNIITDAPADTDPEGDTITVADHNSTFTINSDGSFTYDPATDFCGIYSFDYNITDGIEVSNMATVTIDVRNILQNPVNDSYLINRVDQTLYGNVISNDPNQNYTVTGFSTPSHGTVTLLDSNGSFEYVPDGSYVGDVSFDYTVSDGTTCSTATATVTVKITDMCNVPNLIELVLNPCGTVSPTIISGDPKAYWFTLPAEAILDLNLSNTGHKELEYDFSAVNCDVLFAGPTTSYLPQGDSIDILKKYPQGTYYLGLNVPQNETDVVLEVCYDTNISGGGGTDPFINVGVNDHNSIPLSNGWYDTAPYITTKEVNLTFDIRASYLKNGHTAEYDGTYDDGKKTVDMPVILSLTDEQGNHIGDPVTQLIIQHHTFYSETPAVASPSITVGYAAKIRRFHITSFDFGALFRAATSLNCAQSSLNNSLCLLPACFNTENNIKAVFPPAFYPNVLTCVNGDGGGLSPCDSKAYIGNCGGKKAGTISPAAYDHDLGCASCLEDAIDIPNHSDEFAIRPDVFDVNITAGAIFKAGKDESLLFRAPSYTDNPSTGYNETQNTSFYIDLNVSDNSGCEVKSIEISPSVQFQDGIDPNNIFRFSDIGDINMSIHETNGTEFAIVDVNDTPEYDSTIGGRFIDGRLIREYNVIFTVIPDHFNIEANLSDHNTNDNFTYLHDINITNDRSMASVLIIDIEAMGEDNNITRNYTETCYAKDTNLTLGLNGTNITYPGAQPLDYFLHFNPEEHNISIPDSGEGSTPLPAPVNNTISITSLEIANTVASFPNDAPDGNGTTNIEYKLNFDRTFNLVVNPFRLLLSDVNITEVDPSMAPDDIAKGETGALTDENATMYYVRTKPSKYFYDDETSPATTPISVVVYRDATSSFGLDLILFKPTNEFDWYLSTGHTSSNDGNITLEALSGGSVSPYDPTEVTIILGTDNNTVTVFSSGGALPEDVNITFGPSTNTWMIYNPDLTDNSPPDPFYRVRFHNTADWAGHGDTGNVVNSDASTIKNKRLGW